MLTWDEEVKPSSQKPTDGGLQNGHQAAQSPLPIQTPALQPTAAAHSSVPQLPLLQPLIAE